jgi:hypothetical protein
LGVEGAAEDSDGPEGGLRGALLGGFLEAQFHEGSMRKRDVACGELGTPHERLTVDLTGPMIEWSHTRGLVLPGLLWLSVFRR